MDKYLDKTLLVLILFLSIGIVLNKEISPKAGDKMGTSINQRYAKNKTLGNQIAGNSRIIRNLTQEVQSVKKRVIRVEKEQKEKKSNVLLQQLKTRVDKIDSQIQLINDTVNYESDKMNERINEMAFRDDELNSTLDTLKAEVGSLKQQLLEKDQAYESDIIYNHFYTQNYEPRIFAYSVYKWTISDVKKKVATRAFELESELFPLKGYSFQAKAKLQLYNNNDLIYISLSFQDNNGTHNPVELTVIPQVTFILINVSKNKEQLKHVIRSFNYLRNTSLNYNEFYYNTTLLHKSWLFHEDFNINDTVAILVLVEPPAVSQKLYSTDGVLLQRVTNYKHKLLLEKKGHSLFQQSSYFSTHLNGYRVQVRMFVDGIGYFEGVALTVRILFLTGEFDSTLSSSFVHRTTVTLFNQRDLTNHMVKTFDGDIRYRRDYSINIATHKQLEDDGYLLNDSLIYQVVIKTIQIIVVPINLDYSRYRVYESRGIRISILKTDEEDKIDQEKSSYLGKVPVKSGS